MGKVALLTPGCVVGEEIVEFEVRMSFGTSLPMNVATSSKVTDVTCASVIN